MPRPNRAQLLALTRCRLVPRRAGHARLGGPSGSGVIKEPCVQGSKRAP
ncbi:MAG: hypothetical protein RMK29_05770 [Myxococcales bacterium]|nr:hypothetical protein [Myxococcales bacterium]